MPDLRSVDVTKRLALFGITGVLCGGLISWFPLGAPPNPVAAAAGNTALQSEIIRDPLPNGVAMSESDLTSYLSLAKKSFAMDYPEVPSRSAVLGWSVVSDAAQIFVAMVAQVDIPGSAPSHTQSQLLPLLRDIVHAYCSGPAISRVPKVPTSYYVECPQPNGVIVNAVTIVRKDQIAMLVSDTATMSQKQFDSLAVSQYRALHSRDKAKA